MLTNKDQRFIESIASKLQERLEIKEKPNIYDYYGINKFIENLGYKVVFNCFKNGQTHDTILLEFDDPNVNYNEDNYIKMLHQLFFEIWIITKKKANINIVRYNNADANYFVRAMLMPEEIFVMTVIDNTGLDGMCNIFDVAKVFRVDYIEVSARGKDLGCFNPKGKE